MAKGDARLMQLPAATTGEGGAEFLGDGVVCAIRPHSCTCIGRPSLARALRLPVAGSS